MAAGAHSKIRRTRCLWRPCRPQKYILRESNAPLLSWVYFIIGLERVDARLYKRDIGPVRAANKTKVPRMHSRDSPRLNRSSKKTHAALNSGGWNKNQYATAETPPERDCKPYFSDFCLGCRDEKIVRNFTWARRLPATHIDIGWRKPNHQKWRKWARKSIMLMRPSHFRCHKFLSDLPLDVKRQTKC